MKVNNLFQCLPALSTLAFAVVVGFSSHRVDAAQQQEIPVLITLADPIDLAAVRIFSDGLGPSNDPGTYNQKTDRKVKTFIGLDGQLRFHTYDSPTRSVKVDFTGYVAANGALPFTDARLVQGNIVTLGEDTDGNGMLTAKQLEPGSQGERFNLLSSNFLIGQTRRIGLQLGFPLGQGKTIQNWRVRWGGGEAVGGFTAGLVTVQRISQTSWMIYPGDNDLAAVGRVSAAPVGVCSMPFCLLVVIPN